MNTILSRLADTIQKVKSQPITDHEKNELKNAILDRIGCGLGARRLAIGQEMSSYLKKNQCPGSSIVWGTDMETQAHLAALVNGATSSHLEYDSHDSMIPAAVALGEIHGATGELLLQSLKIEQEIAIGRENYEMAARLRDKMNSLKHRLAGKR